MYKWLIRCILLYAIIFGPLALQCYAFNNSDSIEPVKDASILKVLRDLERRAGIKESFGLFVDKSDLSAVASIYFVGEKRIIVSQVYLLEREFLPAVLEIQQAPPSPIGRAILWTIMAVFMSAVLWASLGWMDIVATAQGKIIPSGYSKVIQPYEAGVIAAIHVQNGQLVKRGDVLIELDPTLNRADHDRASNEYRAAKVEAARLRALIAGHSTFEAPPDGDPQYIQLQRQLLRDQVSEYQARAASAQHLIEHR